MKILCIGCLHGKFPNQAYAVAKKEKVSLVLCPGDVGGDTYLRSMIFKHWDQLHEGSDLPRLIGAKRYQQAIERGLKNQKEMAKKLDGLKLPVLLISGNHDTTLDEIKHKAYKPYALEVLAYKSPYIHYLDVGVANFHGQEIGCISGYRPPALKGITKHERKQSVQIKLMNKLWDLKLKKIFTSFTKPREAVFMCHDPPYKTKLDKVRNKESPMDGRHLGDEYVLRYVKKYQPKFVVCAHMHENQGTIKIGKTIVINCGPAYAGRFAVIDVVKGKVSLY